MVSECAYRAGRESEEGVTLRLLGSEEENLAEVSEALARIEQGTFGCLRSEVLSVWAAP